MKFYSEVLKQMFNTEGELTQAEAKHNEKLAKAEAEKKRKNEERASRAKEVEAAQVAVREAEKKYRELLKAFCDDYGYYHSSIKNDDGVNSIFDVFDIFFGH